jgi:hypothetical protein
LGSSKVVELNQKQVVNVVKFLYDFEQKKATPGGPQEGDYARFFRETKEMAKSKGWNDTQLTEALKNRKKTEVQLDIVSKDIFRNSYLCIVESINPAQRP